MIKLFISHSSEDLSIVVRLVDLCRQALNLKAREIRCTSLDGYRLPAGENVDDQLRVEISEAEVFLVVISTASITSRYVSLELGARWGLNKSYIPLLAPGVSPKDLSDPLRRVNAVKMESVGQLQHMVSDLAKTLSITPEEPQVYQKYIDAILPQPPVDVHTTHVNPDRWLREFFQVGCVVGNKMNILPLPPGSDDDKLTKFLECLDRINLSDKQAYKDLLTVKKIFSVSGQEDDKVRSAIFKYFEAIDSIPEIIRHNSTEKEFDYFTLGQLIWTITVFFILPQNLDEDFHDYIKPKLLALQVLVDQLNLSKRLKSEMRGGSVILNRLRTVDKWLSALVMPPPGWAWAG